MDKAQTTDAKAPKPAKNGERNVFEKLATPMAFEKSGGSSILAERVRKRGAKTLRSFDEILRLKNHYENSSPFVPPSAIR